MTISNAALWWVLSNNKLQVNDKNFHVTTTRTEHFVIIEAPQLLIMLFGDYTGFDLNKALSDTLSWRRWCSGRWRVNVATLGPRRLRTFIERAPRPRHPLLFPPYSPPQLVWVSIILNWNGYKRILRAHALCFKYGGALSSDLSSE